MTDVSGPAHDRHPSPEPRKSRAGRDLPAAIGVGVGMGSIVLFLSLIHI